MHTILSLIAVAAATASAFPHMARCGEGAKQAENVKRQSGVTTFDAATQRVQTTGKYAFVAPGNGDLRGPCPGLNALANHNYLPHNGIVTLSQAIEATGTVFGMATDLATFLSGYSTFVDGDPLALTWSIGGAYPGTLGLLGNPQGLSGSHNKYESDASPGRGDAYLHNGDSYSLNVPNFQKLYGLQPGESGGNYNLNILTQHAQETIDYSRANNAQFFWGPFTGLLVSQAAFTFIPNFMSNHSVEHPEGILNQDVLKTFFSVSGSQGNLKYKPGNERIPDNWYKRSAADPYSIPLFLIDNAAVQAQVPERLAIGGNLGTVNSFKGLDASNLTGGVYNAKDLTDPNKLACFSLTIAEFFLPDILATKVNGVLGALNVWASKVKPQFAYLDCPSIPNVNKDLYKTYPGAAGAF